MRALVRRLRSHLRPLRIYLEWQAMRSCDTLVLLFSSQPKPGKNVIVVKLDAIGDFILWLDAAKELKQLYPNRKVMLLANLIWAELAKQLPYWDEVWPVNVPQLRLTRYSFYRAKLLRAIRKRGIDVAIQPTYSRELLVGDALVRASGARERIGSVGDYYNITPRQKRIANRWYTRLLPVSQNPLMELERNAEFIRNLGKKHFAAASPVLPKLAELPERLRIATPYVILFPGAGWNGRQWPTTRFAEIANPLSLKRGLRVVVCGSVAEAALCQRVVESAEVEVLNLAGQTSLPDFVELVRGARLLIGNETSAVHIAAAVGTPAVCILGGGHYGRFLPYKLATDRDTAPQPALHRMPCFGCDWRCSQPHKEGGPMPCIDGISVNDVLQASERALAAHSVHVPAQSRQTVASNRFSKHNSRACRCLPRLEST